MWTVFFVSDHTGVTAQAIGHSLLAQFSGLEYQSVTLPFVDAASIDAACARVAAARPALAISTLTDPALRATLTQTGVTVFDLFDAFAAPLALTLGQPAGAVAGRTHGMSADYDRRIDAVNFALALDDGLKPERLAEADLVLTGVSRAGKTPTALYLAMHHGIRVANYPLTPEDLAADSLPAALRAVLPRVRGLTLAAERLAQIREARLPGSRYASLAQCHDELRRADALLRRHAVTVVDTTRSSIEEIAAHLVHDAGGGKPPPTESNTVP